MANPDPTGVRRLVAAAEIARDHMGETDFFTDTDYPEDCAVLANLAAALAAVRVDALEEFFAASHEFLADRCATSLKRNDQWLGDTPQFRRWKTALAALDEAAAFDSCILDKPEDRLWHAEDRTWWRRDMKTGRLVSAEAPVVEPRPGGPSASQATNATEPDQKAKGDQT